MGTMNLARAGDEDFIRMLREIILANLENENFDVEHLCRETGISHSALNRRLHALSQNSVNHFIREVRLQKALELLQQNQLTAAEIAFKVGFGSPAYFNTSFHERFGFPPGEVKKRDLAVPAGNLSNTRVSEQESKQEPELHKNTKPGFRKLTFKNVFITFIGILVILIGIFIFYAVIYKNATPGKTLISNSYGKSIVVLPFKNLSNNVDNQYFADGITENILNLLFRISELRVVSRTTSEQFREKQMTIPEIAKMLNVNYVLEGSVSRSGNKVEIFVQLIDARMDQHVISEKFETETTNIFETQSEIAKKVAGELKAVLSPRETALIEKIPTQNADAYDSYLLGRFFLKKRTEPDTKVSKEYFEKSILLDPGFALAYTGLADAYWVRAFFAMGTRMEDYAQCKKLVMQALQLDPDLCEAHIVLGKLLAFGEWKWEEARKELKLTTELNPNSAEAHFYYSDILHILGENEEARKEINKGLGLDPYFAMWNWVSADYYFFQCDFSKAIKEYTRAVELFPDYNYVFNERLFVICFKQGEDAKALDALKIYLLSNNYSAKNAGRIHKVYADSGMKGVINLAIESVLSKSFASCDPWFLASLYTMLGRKNEALNVLGKLIREHNADYKGSCHYDELPDRIISDYADYGALWSEPRYIALIRQMGLTPYFHKGPAGKK
jgi:TolB-like protein/AraC-like DNA-binding protein